MELPILYIGLSQSLFAVVVILMKRPLKIADVILSLLLLDFSLVFGFDILQMYGILPDNRWVISISLFMLFAPLVFLYSKYVTKEFDTFNPLHYLHALPPILLIAVYLIYSLFSSKHSFSDVDAEVQFKWLRNSFGLIFSLLLFIYAYFALRHVIRFRKQIKQYYSYKSDKISLNWLLFVIVSFILIFSLIVISSTLFESKRIGTGVNTFRPVVELFFVYIVSIWGFRQSQLNYEYKDAVNLKKVLDQTDPSLGKYQKSGLKDEQAEMYVKKLIDYMVQTESWKDNELSVGKIASHTDIPKHHITQVLNEYLGKNFYQFVNEYRIEYAKKLLKSPKYSAWSIVAIAYECGFNSKTAFNNFFKKHSDQTPSEFRKT